MKIRISAVNYLNTLPFVKGIQGSDLVNHIQLELDTPDVCARKLIDGEVDIGLVPVAVLSEVQNAHIISDFCIGCDGPVLSVCLFAEQPVNQLENVFLDYQSRTSVELLKILLNEHWNVRPRLLRAKPGYENQIEGKNGGLVIGDRTFNLHGKYPYAYDLGTAWKEYTGLPFVFALWVSNHAPDSGFIVEFNRVLKQGIARIPQIAAQLNLQHQFNALNYFTNNISYIFDEQKNNALDLFLEKIHLQHNATFRI